jgi:hypothetical protein
MADQTLTIKANVQTTGLDNAVNSSSQVHDNLAASARAAQQLERSANNAGDALRRAAAAGGGSRTAAAAKAAAASPQENLEYGEMRGVAGATGAASRDFAKQARGLGGLVRLYATFAANIFAVTAAFNTLRDAMDTTNMIRGLEILGSQSGKSLGALAKQLAQVSDGAISMREAMSATAMTSSAGMTNKQILQLGEVAKNASFALGISMPDAINRLSRGIVKLEPELLDELGIFAKIEPATQAYALQLGKNVSQLTDFERRQAFANAVLKEGTDKFSELNEAASNPFDKLLSSLKNVAQQGLELINVVLAPIAEILSKSPGALAAGLATIVAILVRQAVPALGEFRAGLAKSADDALKEAKGKQGDAYEARKQLDKLVQRDVEALADRELKVLEQKEAKVLELKKSGYKFSQELNTALSKDIAELSRQDIDAAKAKAQQLREQASQASKLYGKTGSMPTAGGRVSVAELRQQAAAETETVRALEAHYDAERKLLKVSAEHEVTARQRLEGTRAYQKLQSEVASLEQSAKKRAIVSNMAYNTSLVGIANAYKLMAAEVEQAFPGEKATDKFNRGMLMARGAVAGVASAIGSAASRMLGWLQYVTLAIAIFELLDSWLTKNAKQTEAFNNSITASEESIKNVTRTIENYEKKGQNTIKSTVALANAFVELADSMEDSIKKFDRMQLNAGLWDRMWDRIKGAFGFGKADTLAKTLAEQLYSAISVAEKFGQGNQLAGQLAQFLNVKDIFDKDAVVDAIRSLDAEGQTSLQNIANNFKSKFQSIASDLQGFKDNLDKTNKTFQEFIQSFINKDPFFVFAENFANLALSMGKLAASDPATQLKAFEELIASPEKMGMLSPEFSQQLLDISTQFKEQKRYVDGLNSSLEFYQKELGKLKPTSEMTKQQEVDEQMRARRGVSEAAQLEGAVEKLNQLKIEADTSSFAKVSDLFAEESTKALQKATEYLAEGIKNSGIRAGNIIAQAYATGLTGERAIRESARLQKSEQGIRIKEAERSLELLNGQDKLVAAIEAQTSATLINTEYLKPEGQRNQEQLRLLQDQIKQNNLIARINKGEKVEDIQKGESLSAAQIAMLQAAAQVKATRTESVKATVGLERAKGAAIDIQADIQAGAANIAQRRELQQIDASINQSIASRLGLQQQIVGVNTAELVITRATLENSDRLAKNKLEQEDLDRRIADAQKAYNATKSQEQLRELQYVRDTLKPRILARQAEEDALATQRQKIDLLNVELETIRKTFEVQKSNIDLANSRAEAALEIERARFNARAEVAGFDKTYIAQRVYDLELQKTALETDKQRGEVVQKFSQFELETRRKMSELDPDSGAAIALTEELGRQLTIRDNELAKLDVQKLKQETILKITKDQTIELEKQRKAQEDLNRKLDLEAARLQGMLATTSFSETFIAQLNYFKQLKDLDAQADLARIKLVDGYKKESARITQQEIAIIESGDIPLAPGIERQTLDQGFATSMETLNADLAASKEKALITQNTALYQAKFNEEMQRSVNLADALKNAFGSVGEKLGTLTVSLTEFGQQQEKNANTMAKLQDALWSAQDQGDKSKELEIQKEISKQRTKSAQDELKNSAKVAGAAKNLFKEKTAAYKAFAVVEKGLQLASLALEIKTSLTKMGLWAAEVPAKVATETAVTGAHVAGASARGSVTFAEIIGNYMSKIPPPFGEILGFAAGALFLALLAKAGAGGGGGGGAPPTFRPTAEQAQEVQGTAMGYDSQGNKVQVRSGVFGDTGAKSESIANSIEIIKDNSVRGLSYDNRVLDTLQSIDRGIGETAKNLYGIPGIITAIKAPVTSSSGGGGIIGKIFGGKTTSTTSVTNAGIVLGDTLDTMASGLMQFTDYLTTWSRSGGWFSSGSSGSYTTTEWQKVIDPELTKYFTNLKTDITRLFTSVAIDTLGIVTPEQVQNTINTFKAKEKQLSTLGLSGEALQKELSSFMSAYLDDLAEATFSSIVTEFRKFGEGSLETVIRVTDSFKKVNQVLKNLNVMDLEEYNPSYTFQRSGLFFGFGRNNIITVTDNLAKFKVSERLIELAGSLQELINITSGYESNFLTEAERLVPVQAAVTKEFNRLNLLYPGLQINTVRTKDEFKRLVSGLDITTEQGQELFISLMRVQSGFNEVVTAQEKAAAKVAELTENTLDYRNATTQLEKDLRKIRKTHTETIKELQDLGIATQENINLLVEYNKFQLLQRIEQDVQKLYETRRNELNKTIDTLTQAKTKILDLRDSLLRGPQSTFTPVQKNVNLRTAYGTLLAQATSASPEERELGRSKIVEIAQQYLQSSQEIYRSGQMYTMVYNKIISDLNTIYGDIEGEIQNAKTDRTLLEESVSHLDFIEQYTKSTAEQLTALLQLYSATNTNPGLSTTIQARATGGLASGVTLVGERGPELVDFRDPGRVYNANQTRGMFGMEQTTQYNQQMLTELRSLNEKIDCLEQVVAEGAVLNANATNKNTQQIVGAVVVNTNQTVESTRLQSRIVIK